MLMSSGVVLWFLPLYFVLYAHCQMMIKIFAKTLMHNGSLSVLRQFLGCELILKALKFFFNQASMQL